MGTARVPLTDGEVAVAVFSPSAVSNFSEPPHGSPHNTVIVTLTELEPRDDQVRVRAHTATGQGLMADVTILAVGARPLPRRRGVLLRPGDRSHAYPT